MAPDRNDSPINRSPAARLARAREILSSAQLDSTALERRDAAHTSPPTSAPAPSPSSPAEAASTTSPSAERQAARSTRLALAVLSGAVRPLAAPAEPVASVVSRARTALLAPAAPGQPSRLELGVLGTALVGAAFIGSQISGATPVQAQGPPVAAVTTAAAAAPAAAAAAAAADDDDDASTTAEDSSAGTAAEAATPAAATPGGDQSGVAGTTVSSDDAEQTTPDGETEPVGGSAVTTLARVALIVVRGDAPARWATAAPGTPAQVRASRGTVFTGVATLPQAPLATGLALIAGQPSNPATRAGCTATAPVLPGTTTEGVTNGTGCDYPSETASLAGAVARDGRTWRAFAQASTSQEAAAKLCRPYDAAATEQQRAAAQRSPLAHLGDLTTSGACETAALPLSTLGAELSSDTPPAWVYIEVGDCGTDGCDDTEAKARDAELDAALKTLAEQTPPDDGKDAVIVVGDGDVPGLEPAPAGSYPANAADPEAPASVITGAFLTGDGVAAGATDPLVLDPFAIARTQATWLGLPAPGQSAAEGVTALAIPGA